MKSGNQTAPASFGSERQIARRVGMALIQPAASTLHALEIMHVVLLAQQRKHILFDNTDDEGQHLAHLRLVRPRFLFLGDQIGPLFNPVNLRQKDAALVFQVSRNQAGR